MTQADGVGVRQAELLLPEHSRLLHIGPPKTGTTALQAAAAAGRDTLADHGVRYPGTGQNHAMAVAAFLERPLGWNGARGTRVQPIAAWNALLREIAAETDRRVWFGHEYAAGADDGQAHRMVAAVGDRTHVVITLRPYADMLPSVWQEYAKAGGTGAFDPWLRQVLDPSRYAEDFRRFHVRHDSGALVERWVAAAGADRVTVVVLDRAQPDRSFRTFERLLGLPGGLLDATGAESRSANRGLTVPEVELFRHLNRVLLDEDVRWDEYARLIVDGAVHRTLGTRVPPPDENRVTLPEWAAGRAEQAAERFAERIAQSGARVVGDLSTLSSRRASTGTAPSASTESVPLDLAVAAIAGAIGQATHRGPYFRPRPDARRSDRIRRVLVRLLEGEWTMRDAFGAVRSQVGAGRH
jgi:hypothetical protein